LFTIRAATTGDKIMAPPSTPPSTPHWGSGDPQAFGKAMGEMLQAAAGLTLPPAAVCALQAEYMKEAAQMWNGAVERLAGKAEAEPVKLGDRRFAATDWAANPATALAAQTYLLNSRTLLKMAEAIEGDAKTKARVRFAVQQWIDAASPSNYLAFNPEAQRKALETKGESIAQGLAHLWGDVQQGHVSQTDDSVFEVGRNVATSEGAVVFENELFQLLEYKPLTAKVHERPMLFVPPCINKYYILDLQPDNSLIRYLVGQGHRMFVMSWRNPDESIAHKTWDDYVEEGPITAIDEVRAISGSAQLDVMGFCVGGTILSTALAVLAARGEQPAASLSLLTSMLDFSNTGVLDIFIDEPAVQLREATIGEKAPNGPGLLKGKELATTFSFLRPNDLVWNYVVGNYLKGDKPPPFDLLYWNGDSTNLPGPMFCWYLRQTYLHNELRQPGKLKVCGQKIDLAKIKAPVFIYGSREDHIVPWDAAFESTKIMKGKVRFVLGASGHIAGVINPPAAKKRSHWVDGKLGGTAAEWLESAKEVPGSWWTDWAAWLKPHAGKMVPAPKAYGDRLHKAIEAAPGRYVKAKA
jgi:polyhydroxyalkanoate synthase subunit PhaC